MGRIAIIGSGRWARVIAQTLCGLPDFGHQILMVSRGQGAALSSWVDEQGLTSRISVAPDWDDVPHASPFLAAIIANRAGDHLAAALLTLGAKLPTLVEKPVAIGEHDVQRLIDCAARNGTMLAASNVFLFSRYVDAFASLVRASGPISAIEVEWIDPVREIRHGGLKSYDASLPVADDVLPHAVPLLRRLGVESLLPASLAVSRGGARVEMAADRSTQCRIVLERNGAARQRSIRVATASGELLLDFAREPGTIATPQGILNGDPDWSRELRPLARMLDAFLRSASSNSPDGRLSPGHAVKSARVADLVRPLYLGRQTEWLESLPPGADREDVAYALRERGK